MNNFSVRLLCLSLFMAIFSFGYSQKKITTEDGKKIIILPDGSWKYDESKEEVSTESNNELVRLVSDENFKVNPYQLPDENNSNISEINLDKIAKLEYDIRDLLNEFNVENEISKDNLKLLKEELKISEDSDEVVESADIQTEINITKERLSTLKDNIKILEKNQDRIDKAKKSNDDEASKIVSEVNKTMRKRFDKGFKEDDVKIVDISYYHFELSEKIDHDIHDCEILFDGMDERQKKYRKETAAKPFFSYTHPKLKSFFKSKDFLNCNANLLKLGAYYYLGLEITISSKDAKKNYGAIERNSMLRINFIDGSDIHLTCIKENRGTIEPYTGNTVYKVKYLLDKEQLKTMSKIEIDKIGLIWTTGFEEYDIYEVDFFMNQISCLNSKNK